MWWCVLSNRSVVVAVGRDTQFKWQLLICSMVWSIVSMFAFLSREDRDEEGGPPASGQLEEVERLVDMHG